MGSSRRSYQEDPGLGDRVFALLEEVFPGVGVARRGAERFGSPWEAASTPFVAEAGGRVIGHVGLLTLPLVLAGRTVELGGVHGVAVHPDYRRAGIFRILLDELFADAAGRVETLILTTVHPEYFTPFGFRIIPESVFVGPAPEPIGPVGRLLELDQPRDRALVRGLLGRRAPLSASVALAPELSVWAFYEAASPVRYAADGDFAAIGEVVDRRLRLYDVIAAEVPSLARVVGLFEGPVVEVLAFLDPERLGGTFVAEPHDLEGGPKSMEVGVRNVVLMARGPFPARGPLILPRPGRC